MQKKQNTKSRATDLLIILFCLAGTAVSGMLFWQEYNRTLVKLNEAPVGTIVFKNRTAHRKIENRIAWDRLKQTSPVYNGDTIRTADLSEAIITFPNTITHISIFENTLIQVFYSDAEGARIDVSSGNLDVTAGSGNVVISGGASTVEIGQGSRISLNRDSEGFGLAVSEGSARVNGTDLGAGGVLSLLADGSPNPNPAIALTAPEGLTRVLGSPEGGAQVLFSWNTANFNSGTHVVLQTAQDKAFTRIVESREIRGASSAVLSFPPGMYFWRALPVQGTEPVGGSHPSGRIEVLPAVSLSSFAPAQETVFTFPGDSSVPFSWSAIEGAGGYLFEISANEDMSAPEISRRLEGTAVVQTGLKTGRWYWRVRPVLPEHIRGDVSSAVRTFSIEQGSVVPAVPVLIFPGESAYLNSETPNLLWKYDSGVESWTVEVADNPQMSNPMVQQRTNANFYSFTSGNTLQIGKTYYWRVIAQTGTLSSSAVAQSFIPEDPAVLASRTIRRSPVPAPIEPAAPEPVVSVPEPPPPPVITEPAAPVIAEPVPESPVVEDRQLTTVSGIGTITGTVPADGYVVSLERLAKAPNLVFNWEGRSRDYYFSLYRADGEAIIVMTSVNEPRYRFQYPEILEAGEYIWQVFERDNQGMWPDAPSVAKRFTVTTEPVTNTAGPALIKQLPTSDPGVLYGNP
jgi:hypothetical protein